MLTAPFIGQSVHQELRHVNYHNEAHEYSVSISNHEDFLVMDVLYQEGHQPVVTLKGEESGFVFDILKGDFMCYFIDSKGKGKIKEYIINSDAVVE